jgi:alkylation response protein AidB-like acyl-CoA dehydrogenase
MGLGGAVAVPESHGGAGLGMVTAVLLEEALATGDAAAPFVLSGPARSVALTSCHPEQAQLDGVARRRDEDWRRRVERTEGRPRTCRLHDHRHERGRQVVLRGEKAFVHNAENADVILVFAQVDAAAGWKGLGAFMVEKSAKGLALRERSTTLGLDAVGVSNVVLEAVRVPESARLTPVGNFDGAVLRFFVREGLKVAARAVGLSQAAFDVALDYVSNRKAFGKPIGHFQAVAFTLADRAMDVDAGPGDGLARGRLGRLRRRRKAGPRKMRDSAWAISYALEAVMKAGDDAVQLHGGAGFMRDYPVEKWMRDAKQLQLCVLTSEQADQIAAALDLGAPLDPALLLPTPETQAVFT